MNTSLTTSTTTAMAASSAARSPFFHAHLQEGQRLNEFGQLKSSSTRLTDDLEASLETGGRDPRVARYPSRSATKAARSPPFSQATSAHAASSNLSVHLTVSGAKSNPSTISYPSSSSKLIPEDPMTSDFTQDLFASIAAEASVPATEGRHYHYLTRSQSSGGYPPEASLVKDKPSKSAKANHTSPELRDPQHAHNAFLVPVQRNLSPIEESSPRDSTTIHTGPQADNISVHSTASNQSGLFINRPVRRTASASSLNSTSSIPPRSAGTSLEREEGLKTPHPHVQTNNCRSAYPRSFSALPVIPASPRESQNVPHDEIDGAGLKVPPAVFLSKRQSYNGFLAPEGESTEGDEFGTGSNVIGLAIGTPSRRISAADSVRTAETQYTYLTAETPSHSRRGTMAGDYAPRHQRSQESAKSPNKLRDLESGVATEDASLGDERSQKFERIKHLIITFKRKLLAGHGGGGVPDVANPRDNLDSLRDVTQNEVPARMGPVSLVAHIAFSGMTKRKPSELLFWSGFVAPWCWLIGGWMLRKDGHAVDGGYDGKRTARPTEALAERRGEKFVGPNGRRSRKTDDVDERNRYTTATNFAVVPSTRTSISDDRPDSAGAKLDSVTSKLPTTNREEERRGWPSAAWVSAKNSSAEILDAMRGSRPGGSEDTEATLRPGVLHESHVSVKSTLRMDSWVARCRVAAAVGGLVLMTLCIVAIVELARAF